MLLIGAQKEPWKYLVKEKSFPARAQTGPFCFLECIFGLAEQEASNTPLTTQVDPQELSNQRYANFPNSNFAASLRLNV